MRVFRKSNQAGDTIVEVLIAMAVVSAVLVGAFTVTQRSVLAVRSGQEHSEALQQLQGQVELVRSLALAQTTDSGGVFIQNFCIDTTDTSDIKPVADSNGACTLAELYKVTISYLTSGNDKRFVFTTTWDRQGGGTDKESLIYRIYPGIQTVSSAAVTPNPPPNDNPGVPATPSPDPVPQTTSTATPDAGLRNIGEASNGTCWKSSSWNNRFCWMVNNIVNNSNNTFGSLKKCTYYWGDLTSTDYDGKSAECQKGYTMTHTWNPVGNPGEYVKYEVYIVNTSLSGTIKRSEQAIYIDLAR